MKHRIPAPRPQVAVEAAARRHSGVVKPRTQLRTYFCRSCGTESALERSVPAGWYSLARHREHGLRSQRLGFFCSITCLQQQIPRISDIDESAGADWKTQPPRKTTDGQAQEEDRQEEPGTP